MVPRSRFASLSNLEAGHQMGVLPVKSVKLRVTHAAGEKLSLYLGAPGLLSTTVAVTDFPLSVMPHEKRCKSQAEQIDRGGKRTSGLDLTATNRVLVGVLSIIATDLDIREEKSVTGRQQEVRAAREYAMHNDQK